MSQKVKDYESLELASIEHRFEAVIIDGLILGLVTLLLFGTMSEVGGGISFGLTIVYYWYFWTRQHGQSPGKRIKGLRVVKRTGERLSDVDAIVRVFGYYINSAILLIGWIMAFFDSERRGLHDMIAGTVVVYDK